MIDEITSIKKEEQQMQRPKGVYIVCGLMGFGIVMTIASYFMILTGAVSVSPEHYAWFANPFTIANLSSMGVATLNIMGMVKLFKLKRAAFTFLFSAFLLNVISTTAFSMYDTTFQSLNGGPSQFIFGFMLAAAISYYVWTLRQKGFLTE